ncbi:hypothetical protein BDN72DRAFT_906150 [Pluteus cervinus]|uniref:Uncharacterized protein n=1 Tax=Pluteus cervinus TaxID=181527 RepID=A0ACD3A133_9AGAR|nr:hypothetical protein BDN72DRAFT_906150 [Pluteus cervinus]
MSSPAAEDVYTMTEVFSEIAAYIRLDISPEAQQWYCSVIPHFLRLRQFTTYPYPTSVQLETHGKVWKFICGVLVFESGMRKKIQPDYNTYANVGLIEAASPPSRHFAVQFASILPLLSLKVLNLQAGWDEDFAEKVQQIGLVYDGLEVLRIKYITDFEGDGDELENNDDDEDTEMLNAEDRPDELAHPWESPSWMAMLSAFPSLRVFYLNTPLLLTRERDEVDYARQWTQHMPNIERVYIYHGYDWKYHFQADINSRGEGVVLVRQGSVWNRFHIPAPGGPVSQQDPFVQALLDEDAEEFGPHEDSVNGLIYPIDEDEDLKEWKSSDEEEEEDMDVEEDE